MSSQLTEAELAALMPSEFCQYPTPIPTQIVSSDEFFPDPQNERQREVETRLLAMADELGGKQGLNRRKFFQSAAGMAASFVAMNEVYGALFDATPAEAATPAMADERANALKDQFIMDMHTHFLRDDTRITTFLEMRKAVGKAGWNKELNDHEQTIEDLKFNNYKKEIFLDSDTKIALISSAPSDIEQDWFLTNQQMADARKKVNDEAGSRRLFCHAIFTPGQPGWLRGCEIGFVVAVSTRQQQSPPLRPPDLAFVRHCAEQVQRQPGREHARQVPDVEGRHDFHEVEANDLALGRYAAE